MQSRSRVWKEHQKAEARARSRALRRLAHKYPADFVRLYNEERMIEGLPAVRTGQPGRPRKTTSA